MYRGAILRVLDRADAPNMRRIVDERVGEAA